MKKRPLQDVVTPSSRPRRANRQYRQESEDDFSERGAVVGRNRPRFSLWIIAGISIIVLGFVLSLFFSGARVSVSPKQQEVFVSGTFTSFKDALVGELPFEVMTIEQEGSQTAKATGEETTEERASGMIIVYNDYNQANQRLIKNTRFESPDGRIYRIKDSIIVPGQSVVDGETISGSIEVTVYADEEGESYNAGLMDFTIPGFEGSPQFEGFHARSKTPMAGGFSGTRLTLDESDRETAKTEIQAKLKESIMIKANSERPDGFYLYNNASFIVFEDLPQTEDGESVTLRIKAVLYGIIFDEDDFAKFIASNTIAGFDGGDVMLLNPEVLSVNTSGETEDRPWEGDAISVDISGTTNIVWVFDEEGLKRDLAGKSKNALPTILSGYTSIQSIEASLWPFWKGSFPEEIDKIRIETNLDN